MCRRSPTSSPAARSGSTAERLAGGGQVLEVPGVGAADAVLQRDRRRPAQVGDPAGVQQPPGGAVGLGPVPHDVALEADDVAHQRRDLPDGDVVPDTDVHRLRLVVALQQEQAGGSQVVDVQELPARGARPPHRDVPLLAHLRLVHLADHRRQDVPGREVEVVARAVEVGRDRRDPAEPMLPADRLHVRDSGQFGHRVRLVRRLQRPAHEVVLGQRLRGVLRVHRAGPEEQQLRDAVLHRRRQHVALDLQVVVEEIGRRCDVGQDAAYPAAGQHDTAGRDLADRSQDVVASGQVQLGAGAADRLDAALGSRPAQGRAHEAAVPGDEQRLLQRHGQLILRQDRTSGGPRYGSGRSWSALAAARRVVSGRQRRTP